MLLRAVWREGAGAEEGRCGRGARVLLRATKPEIVVKTYVNAAGCRGRDDGMRHDALGCAHVRAGRRYTSRSEQPQSLAFTTFGGDKGINAAITTFTHPPLAGRTLR